MDTMLMPDLRKTNFGCFRQCHALGVATRAAAFSLILTVSGHAAFAEVQDLPKLAAAKTGVSVSGISSGAYMAGQFQLAYSEKVVGAAIFAGVPYGCACSAFSGITLGFGRQLMNLSKAVNGCMLNLYAIWGVPNSKTLARQAELIAENKKIDPLSFVVPDKVYLFSGKRDRTVVPAIVRAAEAFYIKLGVPAANIKRVMQYPAGHAFVTEDVGGSCQLSAKPFVVDCDYDQAGDLLGHIYGPLQPRSPAPTGRYVAFNQKPFTDGIISHGLSDEGIAYVPLACQSEANCRVHVSLHGCGQNSALVGRTFVEGSGFDRWADTNRLIILFPQVQSAAGNREACWDWWGYTGDDFLTRDGAQLKVINRMLEHLGAPQ